MRYYNIELDLQNSTPQPMLQTFDLVSSVGFNRDLSHMARLAPENTLWFCTHNRNRENINSHSSLVLVPVVVVTILVLAGRSLCTYVQSRNVYGHPVLIRISHVIVQLIY